MTYLISDMSVQCGTPEHMTFVVLASLFFILFVIGIPAMGCYTLYCFMPGIHFDPTMPINEFNPVAGKDWQRSDRAELLRMKLEATQVFGFMWEGLQQKGWAPMWEWSVIMSRKVVIIMIILLLQNFEPNYQLTFALIVMFAYNLLHVKFHPYDLFYHDRLEMLSLISSEMTLFGGLLITFLNEDKETCLTECETFKANAEGSSSAIGYVIIFFNLLYLSYFMFGVLFHMYYVLIPARCRCKKVEVAADAAHKKLHKLAPRIANNLLSNTNHAYLDHHTDFTLSKANMKADIAVAVAHENQRLAGEKLHEEHDAKHQKLQDRLKAKQAQKKADEQTVTIEMTGIEGKHGSVDDSIESGKTLDETSDDDAASESLASGKTSDDVSFTVSINSADSDSSKKDA